MVLYRWNETDMPKYLGNVRYWMNSGKHFAGELPGDPEVAKSLRIADVFDWYQDCPLQIERAAISGS